MTIEPPRLSLRARAPLLVLCVSAAACGSTPPTSPTEYGKPAIVCPAPVTAPSASGAPIPVVYGSATAAMGKPPVTIVCTPASGSSFGVGNTTVTCTATDALQQTDRCTTTVTVTPPAALTMTRFIAFGDSITWGEDGRNSATSVTALGPIRQRIQLPAPQRYPDQLQALLAGTYPSQMPTVFNDGKQGESAGDPAALARFQSDVGTGAYQAVLLMEGANDVTQQAAAGGDEAYATAAIAGLTAMIDFAKSRNVRPFLATIPPRNPDAPAPPPYSYRGSAAIYVAPFNARVAALARSEGISLVDVYAAFDGDVTSLIGPDGLHPTAAGYTVIAQVFFGTLKSTLQGGAVAATSRTGIRRQPHR